MWKNTTAPLRLQQTNQLNPGQPFFRDSSLSKFEKQFLKSFQKSPAASQNEKNLSFSLKSDSKRLNSQVTNFQQMSFTPKSTIERSTINNMIGEALTPDINDRKNFIILEELEENQKLRLQIFKANKVIEELKHCNEAFQVKVKNSLIELNTFKLKEIKLRQREQNCMILKQKEDSMQLILKEKDREIQFWKKSHDQLLSYMSLHLKNADELIEQFKIIDQKGKVKNKLGERNMNEENNIEKGRRSKNKNNEQSKSSHQNKENDKKQERKNLFRTQEKMNETYRWIIQSCQQKMDKAQKMINKLLKDVKEKNQIIDDLHNENKTLKCEETDLSSQISVLMKQNKILRKDNESFKEAGKDFYTKFDEYQIRNKIQDSQILNYQQIVEKLKINILNLEQKNHELINENQQIKENYENILDEYKILASQLREYQNSHEERKVNEGFAREKEQKKLHNQLDKFKTKEMELNLRLQILSQQINDLKTTVTLKERKIHENSMIHEREFQNIEELWKNRQLDWETRLEQKERQVEELKQILNIHENNMEKKEKQLEQTHSDLLTIIEQLKIKELEIEKLKLSIKDEDHSKTSQKNKFWNAQEDRTRNSEKPRRGNNSKIKRPEYNFYLNDSEQRESESIWRQRNDRNKFLEESKGHFKMQDYSSLAIYEENSKQENELLFIEESSRSGQKRLVDDKKFSGFESSIKQSIERGQDEKGEFRERTPSKNKFSLQSLQNKVLKELSSVSYKKKNFRGFGK